MSFVRRVCDKWRYSPKSRLFFDVLAKVGIRIRPFCSYRISLALWQGLTISKKTSSYEVRPLGVEDAALMAAFPERKGFDERLLKGRFERGETSMGLFDQGRLICFQWANWSECTFRPLRYSLNEDEVYTFDIFTHPEYRGRGVAIYLLNKIYEDFIAHNKKWIVSAIETINKPSIALKHKMGGKKEALYLYITLFQRWHWKCLLKQYENVSENQ